MVSLLGKREMLKGRFQVERTKPIAVLFISQGVLSIN